MSVNLTTDWLWLNSDCKTLHSPSAFSATRRARPSQTDASCARFFDILWLHSELFWGFIWQALEYFNETWIILSAETLSLEGNMFRSWCTASLLEVRFAFPCMEQHGVCLSYSMDSISISCSTSGSSGTFAGSARCCKQWTSFQCRFNDSPFTWRQTWHRDAFGFRVQMADQIDRPTIIIVRCEAKFPVKKPDILETSEFCWEEINLFRGAVNCARFCSSSL
jgi:hypothetical protein